MRCSNEFVQVLGLTVLAWGNSIGDFSTNMAMARKGLANMALTACYAGPVFNLLVNTPTHAIRHTDSCNNMALLHCAAGHECKCIRTAS